MCQLQTAPEVTWGSTTDESSTVLGIVCNPVDHLTIQTGANIFGKWFKIAQMIEGLP